MTNTSVVISKAAWDALIGAGTNRQGAVVQAVRESPTWFELRDTGLIGPEGGLTRTGTIARQAEMDRRMDDLFAI